MKNILNEREGSQILPNLVHQNHLEMRLNACDFGVSVIFTTDSKISPFLSVDSSVKKLELLDQ